MCSIKILLVRPNHLTLLRLAYTVSSPNRWTVFNYEGLTNWENYIMGDHWLCDSLYFIETICAI